LHGRLPRLCRSPLCTCGGRDRIAPPSSRGDRRRRRGPNWPWTSGSTSGSRPVQVVHRRPSGPERNARPRAPRRRSPALLPWSHERRDPGAHWRVTAGSR
jgi:hypothetical protein